MNHCQAQDLTVFVFCSGAASDPARCFDGLQAQTVNPGRVVVIDNAVTPGVSVDPFFAARANSSVAVVRTPKVLDDGELRNFALGICNSPLYAAIDAGLIPAPDWVELLLLSLTPQCRCLIPASGQIAGVGGMTAWLLPPSGDPGEKMDCGDHHSLDPAFIWPGNCILRTEFLRQCGGFADHLSGTELGRDLKSRLRSVGGELLYIPDIRCGRVR